MRGLPRAGAARKPMVRVGLSAVKIAWLAFLHGRCGLGPARRVIASKLAGITMWTVVLQAPFHQRDPALVENGKTHPGDPANCP